MPVSRVTLTKLFPILKLHNADALAEKVPEDCGVVDRGREVWRRCTNLGVCP